MTITVRSYRRRVYSPCVGPGHYWHGVGWVRITAAYHRDEVTMSPRALAAALRV